MRDLLIKLIPAAAIIILGFPSALVLQWCAPEFLEAYGGLVGIGVTAACLVIGFAIEWRVLDHLGD